MGGEVSERVCFPAPLKNEKYLALDCRGGCADLRLLEVQAKPNGGDHGGSRARAGVKSAGEFLEFFKPVFGGGKFSGCRTSPSEPSFAWFADCFNFRLWRKGRQRSLNGWQWHGCAASRANCDHRLSCPKRFWRDRFDIATFWNLMKKVLPWLLGGIAFYLLFIKKGGLSSLFGGGAAAPATATPGNNSTTLIPGQPGASTILESFLGGNSGGLNAASAAGLGTAAGGLLTGLGNLLSGLGKGAAGLWDDVSSAASSVGNALGLTSPTNAAVDSGALNPNAIYSFPSLTASDQAALTAGDYTPYDPATGAGAADLVAADNSGPIALATI